MTLGIFESEVNRKLADFLIASGDNVLEIPRAACKPTRLARQQIELFRTMADRDLIVFTDPMSVRQFVDSSSSAGADPFALDRIDVCALGEAVADELRYEQLHADLVPVRIDVTGATDALVHYLGGDGEIAGKKILIVSNYFGSAILISEFFADKGAEVAELCFTGNDPAAALSKSSRIKAMLLGGAFDGFLFCGTDEVYELNAIAAGRLAGLLNDTEIFGSDEKACAALAEFGLAPRLTAGKKKG